MAEKSIWKRPDSVPIPTVWVRFKSKKTMPNGVAPVFLIQDYTEEWRDQLIYNMTKYFLRDEPLSGCLGVADDSESVEEFVIMILKYLDRKMGLIAVVENLDELGDKSLPALAGYNLTAVVSNNEDEYHGRTEKVRKILHALKVVEEMKNCFEHYLVSEYMYALGLSVDPAYRGHGLGQEILQARFPLCKAVGVKLTVTVFTSPAAQHSAVKAGFELLAELIMDEHRDKDGEPVFKNINTKSMKLMAKRIQ